MNFIDKKVSVKHATGILAKNGIEVNESEASTILDFLYRMAKTYNKKDGGQNSNDLKEKSNPEKMLQGTHYHVF